MAVYVDDLYKYDLGVLGRMKMSHMIADTKDELIAMAEKIGVSASHIQCEGSAKEHFDVCLEKRKLAVANGAVEITYKELGKKIINKKQLNFNKNDRQ